MALEGQKGVFMGFRDALEKVNKKNLLTGLMVCFFALIGLITVFGWLFGFFSDILSGRNEKERLKRFIEPILMCDPVPFAEGAKLSDNLLLEVAMNNIFLNNRKEYAKSDDDEYIIPQSDVEVNVGELFGTSQKLKHQSLGDLSEFYCTYRPEESVYRVQLASQINGYLPLISSMERGEGVIHLTVGYVRPRMLLRDEQSEVQVDKKMIYVVKKEKNKYRLVAIKDPEMSDG
ncbi:hypothetical protein FACS189481_5260 [Clostridia bacterium]|nr:hypothetical protein FACS189481_5260 [Clostridia bacterium]